MDKTLRLSVWLMAAIGAGLMPPANAAAPEACAPVQREQVTQLFDQWNLSLASLNADKVSQRYWPDAVLLPTVSNLPRTTPALVHDYFEHFVAKHPRGRIDSRTVQLGCNTAMDVGTYTFSLMDSQGRVSEVAARYTFVYQYRDGDWRILHHHSSAMPEAPATMTAANSNVAHAPEAVAVPAAKPAAPPAAAAPALAAPALAAPVVADSAVHAASAPPAAAAAHDVKPMPAPPKPVAAASAEARHERKAAAAATTDAASRIPAVAEVAAAAEPNRSVAGGTQMFLNAVASPKLADFYPPAGKPKGLKGTVSMRVCAAPTGKLAGTPTILKSSGSADLDAAAAAWARAARWVPATLDRKPVEGCTDIEVPARS